MQYKVTIILEVNEGHPRKWIPEAIYENLQYGEELIEITYEENNDD